MACKGAVDAQHPTTDPPPLLLLLLLQFKQSQSSPGKCGHVAANQTLTPWTKLCVTHTTKFVRMQQLQHGSCSMQDKTRLDLHADCQQRQQLHHERHTSQ
jgi:hypothetical protein